jgi:WD40 repeat protein/serine/threonine protein kinase
MAIDAARVKSLFLAASDLADPAERAAFLERACGGDAALRARVEALLRANDAAPLPLDSPGEATSAHVAAPLPETEDHGDPTARVGSILAGKYKLIEAIGQGGMGSVFMAQQTEPVKRAVAVKVIKAGMDSKAVLARFEAERQALAMMDHPNIAKVLDAGTTDGGRPFFVMELVKGTPITRYCDEHRLTPRQRLELFVPVCQAIQHAHQKGIIHRDIKPSNVLVARYDDRPVPKVIDFGLAKAAGQALSDKTPMTGFGALVGTPEYMSPEQASLNNLDIDTRSDVYALGVLLYELLTGTTPVDKKSLGKAALLEILRIVREVEAPRPSTKLSTIDTLPSVAANRGTEPAKLSRLMKGELDWLVLKALEKDRSRRYETANALSRDIQRYLADEVVEARPPSAGYRLRKYARRHRAAVLTTAVVAAALMLGIAVATWQAVIATGARNEATRQRDDAAAARDAEGQARQRADEARGQAVAALATSERLTCRLTYERGQALCEQGQIDLGMLWLARALELTPADASDLDRAIRVSLNGWAMQLNAIEAVFPRIWGVSSVALSPDGRTVLTSHSQQGTVRFWDTFTGQEKNPPIALAGNNGGPVPGINRAVFSPNGSLIATASDDRTARVWDAVTRQPAGPKMLHDDPVKDISFNAQANIVATAAGKQVHFWSVANGKREEQRLELPEEVRGVVYGPDGKRLAAWAGDTAWLWDAATLKPVGTPIKHSQPIRTATFSPDSAYLLTNGEDATRFWDAQTGQPVGPAYSWKNRQGSGDYGHVAFRADGKVLATSGFPPRLWDQTTGKNTNAANSLLEAHFVALSPDGRHLVIARKEASFARLALAPGLAPLHSFSIGEATEIMVVSPDDTACVTSENDRGGVAYRLWNIQTGRQVGPRIAQEREPRVCWPVFSPDSRTLATRSGKTGCRLWDTSTGREQGLVLEHPKVVCVMAFSPDSRILVTGDIEGEIRFWDASTGQPFGPPLKQDLSVKLLRFSPDGRKLLAAGGKFGSLPGEARLWDVVGRKPLGPVLDHQGEVQDVAFSPDGKAFLTASFQLRLWDAVTSKELQQPIAKQSLQAEFSPSGKTILALLLEDDVARLFDAETGTPIGSPLRHQSSLRLARFSSDGMLVLTVSNDLTARLWDAATGLPVGPPWKSDRAPLRALFTEIGRSVLILQDSRIARWPVPMPMEGSRERIRLAIEVATRNTLDSDGVVRPLLSTVSRDPRNPAKVVWTNDPWPAARERLLELGGPPGNLRR